MKLSRTLLPVFAMAATTGCGTLPDNVRNFERCMAQMQGIQETSRRVSDESADITYGFKKGEVLADLSATREEKKDMVVWTLAAAYLDPNNPKTKKIQSQVNRCEKLAYTPVR
jgi:hypothetical protein